MIPFVVTEKQQIIAEFYWQRSWTELTACEVQEALDWWNSIGVLQRLLPW